MKIKRMSLLLITTMFVLTYIVSFSTYAQQSTDANAALSTPSTLYIVDHLGVNEVDAESAGKLIAGEFRKIGIPMSGPVYEEPKTGYVYRLSFQSLGEKILVHISREMPGMPAIEKQIWIDSIEDLIKAAPRLVDAVVHNKEITDTTKMETVTQHEAAELNKLPGESLWTMGIFGTFIPGTDIAAKPGYEFGWSYETPKYAVGSEFRASFSDEYNFGSWSIGGRYFFNTKNISPYIGGGLSISAGSYDDYYNDSWYYDNGYYYDDYDESGENSGLGAYFVGGVSMLRLTKSRLKFEIRVDRPLLSFA